MNGKLEYSFDDEPINKSCYDLANNKIEVYFNGYHDLIENVYIEKSCIWTLENWENAKSRVGDEVKYYDLREHFGVFSLILYMKYNEKEELEMLVITVDNRYVTLVFKNPEMSLK